MEFTDTQRIRLAALANDADAIAALRLIFTDIGPRIPVAANYTNEEIGAHFRAHEEAKRLVDAAFGALAQFMNKEVITNKLNPAR